MIRDSEINKAHGVPALLTPELQHKIKTVKSDGRDSVRCLSFLGKLPKEVTVELKTKELISENR